MSSNFRVSLIFGNNNFMAELSFIFGAEGNGERVPYSIEGSKDKIIDKNL